MAAEIELDVKALLQSSPGTPNSGIGVKVTALRNGSVVADMIIASHINTLSLSSVENSVNNGIADGNLSSLGAIGTVKAQGISISDVLLFDIEIG